MKAGDLVVWTIRGYQKLISANMPPMCRFEPSCSQYTATAVRVHGPARGVVMGAWRILRCNPFSEGGYDPVPGARPAIEDDASSGDGHG